MKSKTVTPCNSATDARTYAFIAGNTKSAPRAAVTHNQANTAARRPVGATRNKVANPPVRTAKATHNQANAEASKSSPVGTPPRWCKVTRLADGQLEVQNLSEDQELVLSMEVPCKKSPVKIEKISHITTTISKHHNDQIGVGKRNVDSTKNSVRHYSNDMFSETRNYNHANVANSGLKHKGKTQISVNPNNRSNLCAQNSYVTNHKLNVSTNPHAHNSNRINEFNECYAVGHVNVLTSHLQELQLHTNFPRHCPLFLNDVPFTALLDSGNLCGNVINEKALQRLGLSLDEVEPIQDLPSIGTAKTGTSLTVLGALRRPLRLTFEGVRAPFYTRPLVCRGLAMEVNISGPFMQAIGLDQVHSRGHAVVRGVEIPLHIPDQQSARRERAQQSGVYSLQQVEIPANSAVFIPARIAEVEAGRIQASEGHVYGHEQLAMTHDLLPVPASLCSVSKEGHTDVFVCNTDDQPKTLKAGVRLGTFVKEAQLQDTPVGGLQAPVLNRQLRGAALFAKIEKEFQLASCPWLQGPDQRSKVARLLAEFKDIISFQEEYGLTDLVEHSIDTGDARPIKLKERPINPNLLENLQTQLEHWEEQGVIEPSSSPWSFPLIPVIKKKAAQDGDSMAAKLQIRWCVDFRKLNEITKKDSYPMPNIEDNLGKLAHSKVFSTLDNVGAFHSVPIKKSDREKTAFSAGPYGLYQFARMPFGLTNAPPCYSRLIHKVLHGVGPEVALIFLDDVIVHSKDVKQHLSNLKVVLQAYRKAGLRLKPSKCHLFQKEVEYLGHRVSENGILPMPEYVNLVRDWPLPRSLRELRTFLGKVSYYRKFIRDYAAIAAPLTKLLAQDHPIHESKTFELPPAAVEAHSILKQKLVEAPILGYPRFGKDAGSFILDTDWSGDPGAIGGVLSQIQDGQERVILYWARKLTKCLQAYSSNKGQLLAVLHFVNKWRYYLQYRPFVVRTNHEALKWLYTMQEPRGMIARWLETLSNFDFEVRHRAGVKHGNADSLSRCDHAPVKAPPRSPYQ